MNNPPTYQLALHTSLGSGEVCLLRDQMPIDSLDWEKAGSHSEWLTLKVAELLEQNKLKPTDLKHIYCGVGPGSFTGIRVGVSFSRALAYSLSCPVSSLNTLDLLAAACDKKEGRLLSCIDAQKNSIFLSTYQLKNGIAFPEKKDLTVSILDLAQYFEQPLFVCGDGLDRYSDFLPSLVENNKIQDKAWKQISLSQYFRKTNTSALPKSSWQNLRPLYIKKSAPEELIEKNLK